VLWAYGVNGSIFDLHSNGDGSNPFMSTRNFYERKSMTEDQLIQKMEDIANRYERLLKIKEKQINYLLSYVGGIVLPVQMNSIASRLEQITHEELRKDN
jgi:hypothetical protein